MFVNAFVKQEVCYYVECQTIKHTITVCSLNMYTVHIKKWFLFCGFL